MSLLPCDQDPAALRVVVGRYWHLETLRDHVQACRRCKAVYDAFVSMNATRAGRAGRGASERRGDAAHYRRLAERSRFWDE